MIFIFLGGGFALIAAYKFIFGDPYVRPKSVIGKILAVLITLVLGLVGAGAGLLVAVGVGSLLYPIPLHYTGPANYTLVNLQEAAGVQGHFFLGSGEISPTQYYSYYWKDGDAFHPDSVEAGPWITIYQDDRQDGTLDVFTLEPEHGWYDLIGFNIEEGGHHYIFHIPEGSIKPGFNLGS